MVVERRTPLASRPAEWLSLAATPTFALMAALSAVPQAGAHQMSCSVATHMSPLGGMVVMYALMSAFHCLPWLKLISLWRSAAHPSWLGVATCRGRSTAATPVRGAAIARNGGMGNEAG
jgi:hypothetical protein